MQVKQDGQMFFRTEVDGRATVAHELRGAEKVELKQP